MGKADAGVDRQAEGDGGRLDRSEGADVIVFFPVLRHLLRRVWSEDCGRAAKFLLDYGRECERPVKSLTLELPKIVAGLFCMADDDDCLSGGGINPQRPKRWC